jgi:hypothetical protein
MVLSTDAMNGLGVVLLPVAAGLLLEELTFGGLVRLLLAPRPGTRKHGVRREADTSLARRRGELKNGREMGGEKCLR